MDQTGRCIFVNVGERGVAFYRRISQREGLGRGIILSLSAVAEDIEHVLGGNAGRAEPKVKLFIYLHMLIADLVNNKLTVSGHGFSPHMTVGSEHLGIAVAIES